MISLTDAISNVLNPISDLEFIYVPLVDAFDYCLAEDIYSPIPLPPFRQSAMDGYAVSGKCNSYKVVSEIKAGDSALAIKLSFGEAVRIYTGAIVPEASIAVIQQEIVERVENEIYVFGEILFGMNIREKGEEISKNKLALSKGTKLNSAAIGFLSALGINKVKVYKKPKIAIIVTGSELALPGDKLISGKIYESNGSTLNACLKSLGCEKTVFYLKDNCLSIKEKLKEAINENDLILITGGISVGEHDFVGNALKELKVQSVFYKVKQKPGKPLFYGTKGKKKIFALPGNPAAVLSCYYIYVLPAIRLMMGNPNPELKKIRAKITQDYYKKKEKSYLLKAKLINNEVEILPKQNSSMLSSFVNANSIVCLGEKEEVVKKGNSVDVYLLP
mgnify:CR=1 FL=1